MQRQFALHPSRLLQAVLLAVHVTAMMALFTLPLPLWALAALFILLLASLLLHLRHDAWLTAPSSCIKLVLEGDGVVLILRGRDQLSGRLLPDSLLTPFLTILNVLPQGAFVVRSLIIMPDSLDRESFRQLRVWLKWGGNLETRVLLI